jgi:hypothetical protein
VRDGQVDCRDESDEDGCLYDSGFANYKKGGTPRLLAVIHFHPAFKLIDDVSRGALIGWLERCSSIPKISGSNPSGSDLTFRSDLHAVDCERWLYAKLF